MKVIPTEIPDVKVIEPRVFKDARGYFFESFSERQFRSEVADVRFVQDNESMSEGPVVRGLHFQTGEHAQAKLVRVVEGAVLDVAVDLRPESPTFGRSVAVELSAANHRQLFIPRGFAHGFALLSDKAVFQYKCDNYYCPEAEDGIAWDDAELNISWPHTGEEAQLSAKDADRKSFRQWREENAVAATAGASGRRRILVTGGDGQLGRALRREAASSPHAFYFTDVAELDITSERQIADVFATFRPDTVINCAAYTNVDRAEDEPELARLLNAEAPRLLAEACRRHDALLIHVSTDYVFGGNCVNTPIEPDAEPAPTGVYGVTKLEGERNIAASGCRHVIVRTAWLYSEYGANFVKTMLRLFSERDRLQVVCDQIGTPTYAPDLASALMAVADASPAESAVYHYSNEGATSWYDFACEIRRLSQSTGCRIGACTSEEFPTKARRPSYSVLSKNKIKADLGIEVPYWHDSLALCLANLLKL